MWLYMKVRLFKCYEGCSDGHYSLESSLLSWLSALPFDFFLSSNLLPFVVVQLPNWSDGNSEDYTRLQVSWSELRHAQIEGQSAK